MALTTSYLITTKNLVAFFNALTTAQAPARFSQKFLESLEFKSSNDRFYIALLKGLKFIDDSGVPLDRYYQFLDQSQSKRVLADAIREAYADLFAVQTNANTLDVKDVKNKLRTLTQGQKSDEVLHYMANTFHALCEYANWDGDVAPSPAAPKPEVKDVKPEVRPSSGSLSADLHYNIQIHLPDSRDPAVHEAIFKSLKEHLL